jgi:hypothetical protein
MWASAQGVGRACGCLVLAALLLQGWGGAAAAPDGLALGWPGAPALVALAVVIGLLLLSRARLAPLVGLLPLAALPLLLPGSAVGRALSGAPLLAAGAAGLVVSLWDRARAARRAFLPVVLLSYMGVAARVQRQVGPQGDEPHYLMVADSLLRDGDLAVERDFAEGRHRAFHPADLEPHYRVRGRDGVIYSIHAVGLSLLILPAYALGGYPAASFFMALLAALLAREMRLLLRTLPGGEGAEPLAWVLALSPPLLHFAGLIFTEVPAALAVAFSLRRGLAPEPRSGAGVVLTAAVAAALPWLNVRYVPLAALLLLHLFLSGRGGWRAALGLALPAAASAVGLATYHWVLYGFLDPRGVYGARPELALSNAGTALPGLFLDQEFGLLAYAPLYALAIPGFAGLVRRAPRVSVLALAGVAIVVATVGLWPMWRGGFNPPARFLLPVVPLLAVAVGAALKRGLSAGAGLLVGFSLFTGVTGAASPRLVHRDRDGSAPLFREASGALEWTQLLPGYVLAETGPAAHAWGPLPRRDALALAWCSALALAIFGGRAPADARAVARGAIAWIAATASAAALGRAAPGPRDAVRLLGRPALDLPSGAWDASAVARWAGSTAGWGPAYEPHRWPAGAPLGERLPLRPGSYRIAVDADLLGSAPPLLLVVTEGRAAETREAELQAIAGGLAARFAVAPGESAVSLVLAGGGPLLVREVRLEP